MQKQTAIELLGGTISSAAKAIGATYQAVYKWPDELTPRVADRVHAAVGRMSAQPKIKPQLKKRKMEMRTA